MRIVADLHTHTLVSSHAFSSLDEMIRKAKSNGLNALAVTDHGIGMPDSPHIWYFYNLLRQPSLLEGDFFLLKGVEANAVNESGALDMEDSLLKSLDWVIVSLHSRCIPHMSKDRATDLWLRIAENPLVDMIGHAEQRQYYFDYDKVTRAFAQNNKVVELNANSPSTRPGNDTQLRELMLACKQNATKIAVNSDAHSLFEMGNEKWALDLLREIEFPEELVINSSMVRLGVELALHNRPVAELVQKIYPE